MVLTRWIWCFRGMNWNLLLPKAFHVLSKIAKFFLSAFFSLGKAYMTSRRRRRRNAFLKTYITYHLWVLSRNNTSSRKGTGLQNTLDKGHIYFKQTLCNPAKYFLWTVLVRLPQSTKGSQTPEIRKGWKHDYQKCLLTIHGRCWDYI